MLLTFSFCERTQWGCAARVREGALAEQRHTVRAERLGEVRCLPASLPKGGT